MDCGYLDFAQLYALYLQRAYFVLRAKCNLAITRHQSFLSQPQPVVSMFRKDWTAHGPKSSRLYPNRLRRVRLYDPYHQRSVVLLSNHFTLPTATVSQLYWHRWQIELLFLWSKQNHHIKTFYGTSPHAVNTQIWVDICICACLSARGYRQKGVGCVR